MKTILRVTHLFVAVCLVLLMTSVVTQAQCVPTTPRYTAVNLMNASDYFVAFYVDGVYKGSAAPGELSRDFLVPAGEHVLWARTTNGDEILWAERRLSIPAGSVCTWSITNSSRLPLPPLAKPILDPLARAGMIPLTVPN